MRARKPVLRFVRALLAAGEATRQGDGYSVVTAAGAAVLAADEARALQAAGVLGGDARRVTALPGTAQWLKRQLLEADAFAAQHREVVAGADGTVLNLAESPLARLASAAGGEPAFLASHQVEAGERVRRLVERARLNPRVTMSYAAAHVAGGRGAAHAGEMTDMAADARRQLARIHADLPRDCADVVLDVCGLEKGLQQVESERGWPRRSAKLVLRIGLDRLAEVWGIGAVAIGRERGTRAWMDGERVAMFGDEPGAG
ncbi:MAG: DUF6456 domain-containing protein [Devosia sp.]